MFDFSCLSRRQRIIQRNRTERLSEMLDWKNLGIVSCIFPSKSKIVLYTRLKGQIVGSVYRSKLASTPNVFNKTTKQLRKFCADYKLSLFPLPCRCDHNNDASEKNETLVKIKRSEIVHYDCCLYGVSRLISFHYYSLIDYLSLI